MKSLLDSLYYSEDPQNYINSKRFRDSLITLGFATILFMAGILLEFDFFSIFTRFTNAISRFSKLYLPPNFSEMDDLIEGIWLTIVISIAAGTMGTVLAYLSALGMSKRTGKNKVLKIVLRTIATFIRNVPSSIWAIMLLMVFWFGDYLAFIVMALGTYGFNARLFSDMIDETNHHSIEALEATGATYWQIIFQAVFPETLPVAISWSLYAIETNIRSATIIGMLAGGGIGYLISIYKNFRQFDQLSAAVILIVIIILLFDQLSIQIRKRIL